MRLQDDPPASDTILDYVYQSLSPAKLYCDATGAKFSSKGLIQKQYSTIPQEACAIIITIYAPVNIMATCIILSGGQIHYEGG